MPNNEGIESKNNFEEDRKMKEMKRTKTFGNFLKKITVHASVYALISAPLTYAEEKKDVNWVHATTSVINKIGNSVMQGRQQMMQQMQMQQQAMQMKALGPKPVPSKFFPQCQVAPAVTDFPSTACQSGIGDNNGLNQSRQYKALAMSWDSFLENLMSEGQNSRAPIGLSCLDQEMKKALTQMNDKMNSLQAIINKVKKENQAFEEQNKQLLESMKDTGAELYGNSLNNRGIKGNTNKLNKYFSASCQRVIGSTTFTKAASQGGLVGLQDGVLEPSNQIAADFGNNSAKYEKEIRNQVKEIQRVIKEDGPEGFDQEKLGALASKVGGTQFSSIGKAMNAEATLFKKEIDRIRSTLESEVGYTLPAMDHNFRYNVENFAKGAKDYFVKQKVQECISGPTGLSNDSIMAGLKQRATNNKGTTVQNYQIALQQILNSDAYMQDKLDAIKALDQRFGVGEITIKYVDSNAQTVEDTPYALFKKQVDLCTAQVEQDNTFSTQKNAGDSGSSMKEKIDRADRYIKKALSLEKAFTAKVANEILDQVINCGGRSMSAGACTTETASAMMNPSGESGTFCMAHANQCSSQIKGCFNQAKQVVETKKQEMKAKAAQYNQNVSALVARQEFFLNQMKAQVVADAEFVKRFIPGSNYAWPEDLFVEMPKPELDQSLGVELRGGQSQDAMKKLPEKLGKLKDMLKEQTIAMKNELQDYRQKQATAMDANKQKWNQLASDCQAREGEYAQMLQEQQKKMQEKMGEAQQFCQKYNMYSTNPGAGCGEEADSLFEDSMKASSMLQGNIPGIQQNSLAFKGYCDRVNNEGQDNGSDLDDDEIMENMAEKCGDQGWEGIMADFSEKVNEQASGKDEAIEYIEKIKAATTRQELAQVGATPSDIKGTPLEKMIRDLKSLKRLEFSPGLSVPAAPSGESIPAGKTEAHTALKKLYDEQIVRDRNFCESINFNAQLRAYSACAEKTDFGACFDPKIKEFELDYKPFSSMLRAGRKIASIEQTNVQSDSGRIGEQMKRTPCIAQQGYNGQRGLDINAFDQQILGDDAASIINAITR